MDGSVPIIYICGTVWDVCFFNFTQQKNHVAYDSSWTMLKSVLMVKENAIISPAWSDQTSLFLDSSMPLASLFFAITGDIFISYGISNIVILVLILACLFRILTELELSLTSKLFALNMVICPYLTNGYAIINDLGYFSNVIFGPAFYSLRALLALLIILQFLTIKKTGKFTFSMYPVYALCIIAGSSSGIFMIITVLLPYVAYFIEKMLLENDYKSLWKKEAIFGYICCICIFLGKIFSSKVLHIETIDASRTWTPLERFWENLGSVILGFMSLMGVLPVTDAGVAVLSKKGIVRIFPMFIFAVAVLAICYAAVSLKKNIRKKNDSILLFVNIVALNFIILGLFNVRYGSPVFEDRYLITTYMVVIILTAYFLNNLDKKLIFTGLVNLGLSMSLLANDAVSDYIFLKNNNDFMELDEICESISQLDAEYGKSELVYIWGDEQNVMGRCLRACDIDRVYKCVKNDSSFDLWGSYNYYNLNEDYTGSTYLIASTTPTAVPDYILSQYTLVDTLTNVNIYRCEYNPVDLCTGITSGLSYDYPYSPGMATVNGEFINGEFVTNGTEGMAMFGPYAPTLPGTYNITLYYKVLEEGSDGTYFDIATESGTEQLAVTPLDPYSNSVTLNVQFDAGKTFEYRVYCSSGERIAIEKMSIEQVS